MEDFDKPSQRISLGNIKRTPTHVCGNKKAIVLFIFVFQSNDKTLFSVSINFQSSTADCHFNLTVSSDCQSLPHAFVYAVEIPIYFLCFVSESDILVFA